MKESLKKIVGVVEKLENDFENIDLNNANSKELLKMTAESSIMALNLGRNEPTNADCIDIYDDLIIRANAIYAQLK